MPAAVVVVVLGVLTVGAFVGTRNLGGGGAAPTPKPAATLPPTATIAPAATVALAATVAPAPVIRQTGADTPLTSSGYSIKLSYACISRILSPCEAAAAEGGFAQRVLERTNGQVDIQFTSFPELGIARSDTIPLLEEGIVGIVEVSSGNLAEELSILDIPNLWGLYADEETGLAAFEAIKADTARAIEERSGGVVLGRQFYPSGFIFSKIPLETAEDFKGMKVRTFTTAMSDLFGAMGAEPQFVAFSETYAALERGILNQSQGGNYMDSGIKTGLRVSEEFLGGFSFMYFSPWC